ncbi:MAG: glycosyltransferase family 4 protein [Thermoleophilia bacterium]|nr:glycosyltransferase family 4 protein [Thermoleophilia bacterium]
MPAGEPEETHGVSDNPPLLLVGNFLSGPLGVPGVCEDLAVGLEARGWPVTTASHVKSRTVRLAHMLSTTWLKRPSYSVAHVDVFADSAFIWAEAVTKSLAVLGCPYAITLRSGAFPEFAERWPSRMERMLRSATVVISPSPFLQGHFATIRPDIRVIRNGLHLDRYQPRSMGGAEPRLVWLRSFEQRYNPLLALQVVRLLTTEFPEIEILMAGPDRQDWSAGRTLQEAAGLGIADRVRVMGAIPKVDVPDVLRQGDIFLNTTNVDNAPVTVIEAMACGLCVVSTNAGGVPDLVEDGQDALLVPRGDAQAMADAVRRILLDPQTAARLATNGRSKAMAYAWSTVLDDWEALFRELAS